MAFEVVPTAAGRLHSDQYTKIIIINTPINLRVFPCSDVFYIPKINVAYVWPRRVCLQPRCKAR